MAKFSEKQIRALSAAESQKHKQGLIKTRAGWAVQEITLDQHDFTTVASLERRGYLQLYNKGKSAHINDRGQEALNEWREEQAMKKQKARKV